MRTRACVFFQSSCPLAYIWTYTINKDLCMYTSKYLICTYMHTYKSQKPLSVTGGMRAPSNRERHTRTTTQTQSPCPQATKNASSGGWRGGGGWCYINVVGNAVTRGVEPLEYQGMGGGSRPLSLSSRKCIHIWMCELVWVRRFVWGACVSVHVRARKRASGTVCASAE